MRLFFFSLFFCNLAYKIGADKHQAEKNSSNYDGIEKKMRYFIWEIRRIFGLCVWLWLCLCVCVCAWFNKLLQYDIGPEGWDMTSAYLKKGVFALIS